MLQFGQFALGHCSRNIHTGQRRLLSLCLCCTQNHANSGHCSTQHWIQGMAQGVILFPDKQDAPPREGLRLCFQLSKSVIFLFSQELYTFSQEPQISLSEKVFKFKPNSTSIFMYETLWAAGSGSPILDPLINPRETGQSLESQAPRQNLKIHWRVFQSLLRFKFVWEWHFSNG